eukprot:TRINITY_DN459_c0_g1_i1.p1 TRINITY_DN459_c0_g1~~TRINITY_DN459_c0_g1_i1.p1  ORF type:complete len:505 (-),score=102.81 TRINITY_DN459_c0_g1_i1:86-1600(-)
MESVASVFKSVSAPSLPFTIGAGIVIIGLVYFHKYFVQNRVRQFPSPAGLPFLGNIFSLNLERYTETFDNWHKVLGDTFATSFMHYNLIDTVDPKIISQVLHSNDRDDMYKFSLTDFMGKRSVILNDGPLWKAQRTLLNPTFSSHTIHRLMLVNPRFLEGPAEALVRRLKDVASTGKPWQMNYELARCALAVVGSSAVHDDFGYTDMKMGDDDHPFLKAIWSGSHEYNKRIVNPLRKYLNISCILRFNSDLAVIKSKVKELIQDRIDHDNMNAQGEKYTDSLAVLVDAAKKGEFDGVALTEADVIDNIVTILLAGHETSACALAFALYRIAENPHVEKRLIAEIDAFGDKPITYEALNTGELKYTGMVINEALRMNPVAPSIIRKWYSGQPLGDGLSANTTSVAVTLTGLHMDPRQWPNPEVFDPERFNDEETAKRPLTAYLPFGGGPRTCIGKKMALLEMKYLLATLYRNFTFAQVPGHNYEIGVTVTMHEIHGMPLLVQARQ